MTLAKDPRRWGGICQWDGVSSPMVTIQPRLLDPYGYDSSGRYFGNGLSLYCVTDEEGDMEFFIRADDLDHARDLVLERVPTCRFSWD